MKKIVLLAAILSLSLNSIAQNLFPYKLSNCVTETFCLDCGDVQANVDQAQFMELIANLNKSNDYSRVSGTIMLQVLIDSTGKGCVLSHTEKSNSPITQNIVNQLNDFKGWIPAKEGNKIVGRTSINLSVQIKQGILTSKIERVDQKAFMKSFDHPADPEIYNKDYVYKNENLKNYTIKVWNSANSNLPNNFDNDIAIDKNNTIWLTVDEGLVKFDGTKFADAEQNITDKGKYFGYHAVAADNNNVKWVYGGNNIYSYDDSKWTMFDPNVIGIDGAYKIINNASSGEVFFCSEKGLIIYKGGNWSALNHEKIKELPSDRVYFAKRDSKNRIWIGTFSGSVLIDENGKAISFNETGGVLKDKCISSMDEDENGNVFLGLYEYERKDKTSVNNDEGIAICYPNGDIKQFTTANSGMPFNHVTKVLYDKREKALWIATDRAGLVRYDLKNIWENYNNKNSDVPTSYISDMAFDQNGILYLATRQGLVKIERK
jgi:ligand-binding sensor domain-containing protein